ncbi:hypothetical protein FisN_23Lh155 [Fistulifera solaris]|uniref:PWWP domain-containing protein n=1 Tax=Fistulifera solaris TaxID=1519565 RepID=A0A1Z5K4R5_FISSO|nr:hypothetical protein FisN_23Lh155 [Fistulifera solaris]|eukprot:GAX21215.1 hypothetical protein FisN_23Lh155 [Fistulifera solaris]
MTQNSQKHPGTIVMYKLQEENMWWPAIHYPSHQIAQEYMTQENYKSDFHGEILQQYLLECDPTYPVKPVVCVLAHPNKPPGKSWWFPVENMENTEPLTMLNVKKFHKSTPVKFQNALDNTLRGIVLQKLASKEYRIDDSPTKVRGAPHVSPETIQKSSGAIQTGPNDSEVSRLAMASKQPPSGSVESTENTLDTPVAALPNDQIPLDLSAKNAARESRSKTPISSEPTENSDPVNTSTEETTPEDEPMPMDTGYETAPFDLDASFEVAWDKLEDEGWYEHRSRVDLNMLYSQPRYLGGRSFQRHELEEYLRETYGWSPSEVNKNDAVTTPNGRTKLMDPGQPLPQSSDVSDVIVNASTLEREGWKIVKGGTLQNYLYLRPGVKKGEGTLGIDYFTSLHEALDAYIAETEDTQSYYSKPSITNARPRRLDLEDEASDEDPYSPEEPSKKKATKKTPTSSHRKKQNKSKSKDHKNAKSNKSVLAAGQKQKKKGASSQQTLSVPTSTEVIALLLKVGFQQVDENTVSFQFTESLSPQFSLVGLSVFLARYGIPNSHKLKAAEMERVTAWVRLANISKVTWAQLQDHERLSSVEVVSMLKEFDFEEISGEFFIPNVIRDGRVHGIHYFREERLQTEFRAFLGWALDYAAMLDPVKDNQDGTRVLVHHLAFVSKIKVNSLEHRCYTKLRLWAAANSAPLPSFSMRKLDLNFLNTLVDPTIKVSVMNARQSRAPLTQTPSVEDECPPVQKTKERKQPPADKPKSSSRAWHQEYVGGVIDATVLGILKKLGFQVQDSQIIVHPAITGKQFTLEEVRRYMIQNYIFDFENKKRELDKSELQMLHRWCCYINLDHKAFMSRLPKAKVLTDIKVVKVLQTLGFGCVSGDYYLPGADRNRLTRRSFTLTQLLEYCRSHAVWSINGVDEIGIHSYKMFNVDLSDWVDMLLTMARVDQQIPAFKTPLKEDGRSKRRRESLEDIEIHALIPVPRKKAKKACPVIDDTQLDVAEMQIEQQSERGLSEHIVQKYGGASQKQMEEELQTLFKDVEQGTAPEVGGSQSEVSSNEDYEEARPENEDPNSEVSGMVESHESRPAVNDIQIGKSVNVEQEETAEVDDSQAEASGNVEQEEIAEVNDAQAEVSGNIGQEETAEVDVSHAEVEQEEQHPEIDDPHAEVSGTEKQQQSECTTYPSDHPPSVANHEPMFEMDLTQDQPLTQYGDHMGQEEKSQGHDSFDEMEEDDMFFDPLEFTQEETKAVASGDWLTQKDTM